METDDKDTKNGKMLDGSFESGLQTTKMISNSVATRLQLRDSKVPTLRLIHMKEKGALRLQRVPPSGWVQQMRSHGITEYL